MTLVLFAAGVSYLGFGLAVNFFPQGFSTLIDDRPLDHPMVWRAIGLTAAAFGVGFLIAAKAPFQHWALILVGFVKATLVVAASLWSAAAGSLSPLAFTVVAGDDLLCWFPLALILWHNLERRLGKPGDGEALDLEEAASLYRLSSGESLRAASESELVCLVFLRHFGCTFTRKILRELESLKEEAEHHRARLVLVHMLVPGGEETYLPARSGIARIADPRCDLYRAFGLGKGGFWELFGPPVWIPLLVALIRGCGMGHLAGDGLQLPGAFLFRKGNIISAQRARTQADLPDLPRLFEGLPRPEPAERLAV
ncbi:AhpC/TSA family protein [Haloferula sargassicola]|uniref:Alkyl hydroperoxide reductase subunit C/ Thiol specific antioxidant domain-containing protein n=1 Tax=Haloferula sargassicola TaxID=490096 RepID=A0ABP9UQ34_9BACT